MPKTTFTDEQLAESEGRLREGDKSALLDVLYYYIIRGVRIPIWVSVKFWEAYAEVYDGHASSWDDVFGKPWSGRHLSDLRKRKRLARPICEHVEKLRAEQPVDEALFEKAAKDLGIGIRQVKETYYAIKMPKDGLVSDPIRELGILNVKRRTEDT